MAKDMSVPELRPEQLDSVSGGTPTLSDGMPPRVSGQEYRIASSQTDEFRRSVSAAEAGYGGISPKRTARTSCGKRRWSGTAFLRKR